MEGGADGDFLFGEEGFDTVEYSSSNAGVRIVLGTRSNGSDSIAEGGHAEGDHISLVENVTGSRFGDDITGNALVNTLVGGDGNDELSGLGGRDRLIGGRGSDTLSGGTEDDVLFGGEGDDRIDGGDGIDTVSYDGERGQVTVNLGSPGSLFTVSIQGEVNGTFIDETDILSRIENVIGSVQADSLKGNSGRNVVNGGNGDDRLTVTAGGDILDGDGGNDTLFASDNSADQQIELGSSLRVSGSSEVTTLRDIENVFSGAGNDTIVGTGGANRIVGGDGIDTLTGNGGDDVFQFFNIDQLGVAGEGRDRITDFAAGDKLDFSKFEGAGNVGLEFIGGRRFSGDAGEIRATVNANGDTVVSLDFDGDRQADARLQLTGSVALTDADFLF